MFKKTFVRVTLMGLLLVAGTLFVLAAWAPKTSGYAGDCKAVKEAVEDECGQQTKEQQGEFRIWETLNRTLMSIAPF